METSQIAAVTGRDISIVDVEVVPAVIVDVHKAGAPSPPAHVDPRFDAAIFKLNHGSDRWVVHDTRVLEQCVPTGESLETLAD